MFKKFSKWVYIVGAFTLISFAILPVDPAVAIVSGYMLSSIFSLSGLFIIDRFFHADQSIFVKVFFFSLSVRFLLVIVLLGTIIGLTKIDEIYFTVSFLISYLCQSVTEMILFNNSLQQHSKF